MAWFRKKEEKEKKVQEETQKQELPELPELPKLPELPRLPSFHATEREETFLPDLPETEIPSLPSFPNSEIGTRFNQEAIKDAIERPVPSLPKKPEMHKIPKPSFSRQIKERMPEIRKTREIEPVFIRIDKFQEMVKAFSGIRKTLSEIESALAEIRELKNKESAELQEWENQLNMIKTRIDNIDSKILRKLD